MAMKRCPVCGERYSDTYKRCPFCEEEEALRKGKTQHQHGGHRVAQNSPGFLSPLLILAIIAIACVLVYLLFGNAIADKLGIGKTSEIPAASMSEPSISSGSISSSMGAGSSSASAPGVSSGTGTSATNSTLQDTLKLSSTDFTMNVGDSPVKMTVVGGSGDYSWSSEDDGIASVDANGTITAISEGTVIITASNGKEKGTCIVRIKGTGTPNTGISSGNLILNHEDTTIQTGESFQLSVSGTTSSVQWSSGNSGVASVDSNGTVVGVTAGWTTITATVDGKSLTCIVRVK